MDGKESVDSVDGLYRVLRGEWCGEKQLRGLRLWRRTKKVKVLKPEAFVWVDERKEWARRETKRMKQIMK